MKTDTTTWKAGILLLSWLFLTACQEPVEPEITVNIPVPENTPVAPARVDPRLPSFEASNMPQLGSLHIVADSATIQLAQLWASTLSNGHTSLQVQTRSAQSESAWWSPGPTHNIALLKEEMGPEERAAFELEWGYPPERLIVAMDPMVVVVQKGNPLADRGISLQELEAIFSRHPRHGNTPIRKWSALEFGAEWSQRSISPYGQESDSPLHWWFRQRVLERGDYRQDMAQVPDSETVVAEVTKNADGIGYAALSAFKGPVSPVPITDPEGEDRILPTADNLFEERYPLSPGNLYLYINHRPGVALDALQRELVRFIYSQAGQRVVAELGMVPVSALHAGDELRRREISLTPEDVILASWPDNPRNPTGQAVPRHKGTGQSFSETLSAKSFSTMATTSGASHSSAP